MVNQAVFGRSTISFIIRSWNASFSSHAELLSECWITPTCTWKFNTTYNHNLCHLTFQFSSNECIWFVRHWHWTCHGRWRNNLSSGKFVVHTNPAKNRSIIYFNNLFSGLERHKIEAPMSLDTSGSASVRCMCTKAFIVTSSSHDTFTSILFPRYSISFNQITAKSKQCSSMFI